MKRIIRLFQAIFLAIFLLSSHEVFGQQMTVIPSSGLDDSTLVRTEVSLLTCMPHEEVYSLYGHTALRVFNAEDSLDVSVNWGVFDSSKPNFVMNFILGLTDYVMAVVPTRYFLREYCYYGSMVYQQRLRLTVPEKRRLLLALQENCLPENRTYRYNFYYDNCTTRARDVILDAIDGSVDYAAVEKQDGRMSFRNLIHWKTEGYPWCRWGNDFLLGVQSDRETTPAQREFIPEVLLEDFESAAVTRAGGEKVPLVDTSYVLLPQGVSMAEPMSGFPLSPLMCAVLLFAFVALLTVMEVKVWHKKLRWIDTALFYVFGILGLLLAVMMFSEHPTVRVNLQILLFCPLWLVLYAPFFKWRHREKVTLAILCLFFLGNIFQCYAEGMNVLALILLMRTLEKLCFPRNHK